MKKWRMIIDFGIAIYEAIKEGKTDKRIRDVLPVKYAAEVRLLELEAKAREDYRG